MLFISRYESRQEATQLEYDYPPNPKPREEKNSINRPRPIFQLFGVYCTMYSWLTLAASATGVMARESTDAPSYGSLGLAVRPRAMFPWLLRIEEGQGYVCVRVLVRVRVRICKCRCRCVRVLIYIYMSMIDVCIHI